MLIPAEFSLEKFSSLTYCILGCSLAATADALASIAAKGSGRDHLTSGEFTLDEIFAIGNDGIVTRKNFPSSHVAIMYSQPSSETTIVMSSVSDGWITLCNLIALNNKTSRYAFALSDDNSPEAKNALEYRDYSFSRPVERVVYAMKDPRWVFYQDGDALWFEETDNYGKRKIKDRINKMLLVRYCEKLGLKITAPEFFNKLGRCLRFELTW
jgi:hypothetical protein